MARKKGADNYPKIVTNEEKKINDQLPSYFHNLNNRVSMGQRTEKSYRETK